MCEYVDSTGLMTNSIPIPHDREVYVGGMTVTNMFTKDDGFWECWHPETDTWEAMYEPPPGMGLRMSSGSKIRFNTIDKKPDHTKNTPPPEATPVGTQMRDLINR